MATDRERERERGRKEVKGIQESRGQRWQKESEKLRRELTIAGQGTRVGSFSLDPTPSLLRCSSSGSCLPVVRGYEVRQEWRQH